MLQVTIDKYIAMLVGSYIYPTIASDVAGYIIIATCRYMASYIANDWLYIHGVEWSRAYWL